jgi:hypothetical protein
MTKHCTVCKTDRRFEVFSTTEQVFDKPTGFRFLLCQRCGSGDLIEDEEGQ